MSFGFSVGDFITVGKIIADITSSLREVGGSKSEYREVLQELECLQYALRHLDKLHTTTSSTSLESIKYAAISCRQPLEQFLAKINRFDESLGVWGKDRGLRSTKDKLMWAYGKKDELRKLQSYLNVHVGIINILLAEHGLERMELASNKAEADNLNIQERLDGSRKLISSITDSVAAHALVVRETKSMVMKLCDMVGGEFKLSLKTLGEMAAKVCVSTQQIYCIVLDIKGSLTIADTRWTFFQAPFVVEDALGFKFPVPSEYDFQTLEVIIKHRFRDGPGSQDVKVGNYELVNTKDSSQVVSASSRLLPGTNITMAVLLRCPDYSDNVCPIRRCGSLKTTTPSGGGRICSECKIWFDRSNRAPNCLQTLFDIIETEESTFSESKKRKATSNFAEPKPKIPKLSSLDDDGIPFKNIRFSANTIPTSSKEHRGPGNKQTIRSKLCEILNDDKKAPVEEYDTIFHETGQQSSGSARKEEDRSIEKPIFLSGIVSTNSFLDGSANPTLVHGYSDALPSVGFDSCLQQSNSEAEATTDRVGQGSSIPSDELHRPARSFWTQVKDELCNSNNVQTHENFLGLMNDYKVGQFDALTLMSEMKDLLHGHDDLLSQFATFFPPQYGYQLGLLGHRERKSDTRLNWSGIEQLGTDRRGATGELVGCKLAGVFKF